MSHTSLQVEARRSAGDRDSVGFRSRTFWARTQYSPTPSLPPQTRTDVETQRQGDVERARETTSRKPYFKILIS